MDKSKLPKSKLEDEEPVVTARYVNRVAMLGNLANLEAAISQLRADPKPDNKKLSGFNDNSGYAFKPFFKPKPDNKIPPALSHPYLATASLQLGYRLHNGVIVQDSNQNAEEVEPS